MIIVLGGFVFTGRHVLARHLAALMGAHRFSVNEKKLRRPNVSRYGALVGGAIEPDSDRDLEVVYRKVLADLPLRVKMYDTVIVDDAFHRQGPREMFLREARKLGDVVFVWVDAPDRTVPRRVPYLQSMRVVKSEKDALDRFALRKSQMQFSSPPLIFFHEISSRAAAARLRSFIELAIDRGFTEPAA